MQVVPASCVQTHHLVSTRNETRAIRHQDGAQLGTRQPKVRQASPRLPVGHKTFVPAKTCQRLPLHKKRLQRVHSHASSHVTQHVKPLAPGQLLDAALVAVAGTLRAH